MSTKFRESEMFQSDTPMFNPRNFNEGQHQVVGGCNGYSMEERWQTETPIFKDIILEQIKDCKIILDYGCGVGRLAKEIIKERPDITIVGVDVSSEMLRLAEEYVNSENFITKLPYELNDDFIPDFTYCVYVLQHIPLNFLPIAIKHVSRSNLLLVNSVARMSASPQGFINDGFDILGKVAKNFSKIEWAVPAKIVVDNLLIRKMFMGSVIAGPEGNTEHYAFTFKK